MLRQETFISVHTHGSGPIVDAPLLPPFYHAAHVAQTTLPSFVIASGALAALYRMWKDTDAAYYGVMDQNRLLNFGTGKNGTFYQITPAEITRFGWTQAAIRAACETADILLPVLAPAHPAGAPQKIMSNREVYGREYSAADLETLEALVLRHDPDLSSYLGQVLDARETYPRGLFIMASALFHDYCPRLFKVLGAMSGPVDGRDRHQEALAGYLFHAYVLYATAERAARLKPLPLVTALRPRAPVLPQQVDTTIRQQRARAKAARADAPQTVHVVLAIDDAYAPHAGVTIASALDHGQNPEAYVFHILEDGGLHPDTRDKLGRIASAAGSTLEFVVVDAHGLDWLPLNRAYISRATYYRLIMHHTLSAGIGKVIYMDADTVVTDSLETLWAIDLEGHPIAAAPDEGGRTQSQRLRLPDGHIYFNAGVAVFDLDRLRALDFENRVAAAFTRNADYITLQDQDILNIVFCGEVKSLPLRWNANTRLFINSELDAVYSDGEALAAAQAPGILHFTDRRKPWSHKNINPMGYLYWQYRNRTPWPETWGPKAVRLVRIAGRKLFSRSQRTVDAQLKALRKKGR